MFETAELGVKVGKKEFDERETTLRTQLLMTQQALKDAEFPVIILFGGVDGAGKSETAQILNEWMDPRWISTRAFGKQQQEEEERPRFWRYWRALPQAGRIGILLSAWYSEPILAHVHGGKDRRLEADLEEIQSFERMLANHGALILKFWMHLGKEAQKRRFKKLEKDPLQSWRVTETDWKHYEQYDDFVATAETVISRTSTGRAPWFIVEGADARYRSLRVGELILNGIQERMQAGPASLASESASLSPSTEIAPKPTVLDTVDLSAKLDDREYKRRLKEAQARLNDLHRRAHEKGVSTLAVLEGWDAAGKGGAIRRVVQALDVSRARVYPFAAPTDEERAHHYLWRFWRHVPGAGEVALFDRSWYGRVLVERVEGFAAENEWERAYAEINLFERQLVDHGIVLLKFWVHLDPEEQLRRFKEREQTPHKSWKLTDEDWRNRERWPEYARAVHDMVERTSTRLAPWQLVAGNDKRNARVTIVETLADRLEEAL
ncbi:MAG: polyphosphate:AMP phosphotransferase [Myxococcales bacterium]|nr:polyphosphate:AMP phosphotransferase [Myxococcales bacterium]